MTPSPSSPDRGDPTPLTLTVDIRSEQRSVLIVTAEGDIEMATAPRLIEQVETALAQQPRAILVELSGIRFFGSAGLTALQKLAADADAAEVSFCVVAAHRAVLRPLQLTALDQVITVRPDLASARSWCAGLR